MLSVNRQKNYSRDEHNDEDQNQSECRIAVCAEYGSVAHSTSTAVQSVKRQGYSRDDRLSAVINRYEARAAAADDAIESDIENEGEIEEIALLAERALRMPNEHDPGIWRVRVLDGAAEESFFLLQDRLKARPRWAFSTFLPPGSRQWIYVESASRDYVKNLCKNLSTFPHPLQIFFVPVEEHLESLNGSRMMPSINPGSWVRLKRRSELEGLVPNLDERLIKYANDLGYVAKRISESQVAIHLVPRLLVPIESNIARDGDREKRRKKKRCPRLLHPRALGNPEDATVAHLLDPNVWWDPKTPHQLAWVKPGAYPELAHPMDQTVWWDPKTPRELVRGEPGTYRLAKRYGKRTIDSSDSFLPPFAYFSVPIGALHSTGVVPKHSELRLFGEGLAIGAKGLHFPASEAELIRWSFENHIASPLEVGHKVEIKLDAGMARGVIVDLWFEDAVVRLNDSVEAMEVDARRVRRFYEVGDKVKAVVPTNLDCEGWVVDVSDEKLAVFDRNQKEHLDVKSWQLIPHDSVEHGFARRIQVGDAVQVIYPKSPNYHEHGLVCSIADFGVEVIGHKPPNTKFWEPHWFLNVVSTTEGGVEQKDCSLAFHDRYKELINTWVVVTGNHAYKGLFGRIRDHLGQQMLSIEPTSGALPVAVHVDFLLNGEEGGPDLRRYHVGLHQTPATMGHRLPPRLHRELAKPARPTTPGADEPVTPEGGPEVDQRDRVASSPGASGPEDPPITPATASQPAAVIDPPRLERVEPMISHENQALPANWLMKHGLVAKRIWAYVRNSKTNPFEQGGGYARGFYEGERVLILSGEMEGGIEVNAKERTIIIPSYFLFPQMPTSRGQDVVVISGDNAGELYLTRKPNRDGTFPLGRRGHKGSPVCTIEPSRLARCDPK
ncbi:hypothetical protein F5887DRAFT_922201 [Amanita rubescens]|nr:hypothetical protein F5887DRAFT_922201 [Amanita rubescens]